jgi:aminopeptidase N
MVFACGAVGPLACGTQVGTNPPDDAADAAPMDAATDTVATDAVATDDGATADETTAPDVPTPVTAFRGVPIRSADRGLEDVDAIGYEVDLAVDDATPGRESYRAVTRATLLALRDLTAVSLDFVGNTIAAVEVDTRTAMYSRTAATLTVQLPSAVAAGQAFVVTVHYRSAFGVATSSASIASNLGLMVDATTRAGRRMFLSLDEPSGLRRWVPSRDHPRDGAMFALRATFPAAYVVLGNGRRLGVVDLGDGTRAWDYEALTPMPPHSFGVVAFDNWTESAAPPSSRGLAVRHFEYPADAPRVASVMDEAPRAMDWLEANFGAFRWDGLAFVEQGTPTGGGMEHATIVAIGEDTYAMASLRDVMVHEMTHHWSGNLVRIASWNDLWLAEGVTEYLTRRYLEQADGAGAAGLRWWRGALRSALPYEAGLTRPPPIAALGPETPNPDALFTSITYRKSAMVLRTLERVVGTARFTTFLHDWFDRHAFGSASSDDLQHELEAAASLDLARFFAEWVHGAGYPVLNLAWTWDPAAGEVELTVTQQQTTGPAAGFAFPLEVEFASSTGTPHRTVVDVVARTTTVRAAVPFAPTGVVLDPDHWLYGVAACDATHPCRAGYTCGALSRGQPATVCIPPA